MTAAKIYQKFQNIQTGVMALALAALVSLVILNVITRFVFNFALSWTEECARYLFVQIIFLGCGIGVRDNRQIRIDLIDNFIKGKAQKVLAIIQHLLSIAAAVMLMIGGFGLIRGGYGTLSSGMRIPMHLVYICTALGSLLAAIELARQIFLIIKNWKEVQI